MAELTAFQRALVRHLIACELDNRERDKDAAGKTKHKTMSDKEFADILKVHTNTVSNHKKLPHVQAAVKQGVEEALNSRDYFRLCMRQQALEEMWTNYKSAKGNDKRQYLRMILDETKDIEESDETPVDYRDLTDEDLLNEVMLRDLSVLGMTARELRAKAKGEAA